MASITVYDAYFPLLTKSLDSAEAILTKAQAHAAGNGINADTEYAPARLYETMEPLPFQIQVITKLVQRTVELANGTPCEGTKNDEVTLEQMLSRIRKSRELLKSVGPDEINSKAGQATEVQVGPNTQKMVPEAYITQFILPNVFFHVQTTYSILRMKGVPLGKMDFLASFLA